MIDRQTKQSLGQMIHGVEVVGARHDGISRAYTSHWVSQVSFDEPIVMASVSPKHDTYPLMKASGEFSVSVLAGDQITEGQYFSYPGHRLLRIAQEYLTDWPSDPAGPPVVPGAISWLRCAIFRSVPMEDHELMFARVTDVVPGRLKAPPLLYSSRLGWRVTGGTAREPGAGIRDQLLARVAEQSAD